MMPTQTTVPISRADVSDLIRMPPSRRTLRRLAHFARTQPLGVIGFAIIAFMVLLAVLAAFVAPYSASNSDFDALTSPSWAHPFGTDRIGRDVFSRVIFGARTSMLVGLGSVAIATLGGTVLGLISGYLGGWVDALTQRLVDVVMAFPFLVLALFVGAVAGRDMRNLIAVLGFAMTPGVVRVVRASVLSERERDYVLAAKSVGISNARIMARHILPNVAAPVIVIATSLLAAAILAEAALSFLGFGVPPPTPSWGGDLSGPSRAFFQIAPWMAIFPGVALSLAVLGFNFLGDSLRDVLDPRLRGSGRGVTR